jgi:hypothetical protein
VPRTISPGDGSCQEVHGDGEKDVVGLEGAPELRPMTPLGGFTLLGCSGRQGKMLRLVSKF